MTRTAMTQAEFDAVMNEHEKYQKEVANGERGDLHPVEFFQKDLRKVDMEGRNYDAVTFRQCQMEKLPITQGASETGVYLYRCQADEIEVTAGARVSLDAGTLVDCVNLQDAIVTLFCLSSRINHLNVGSCEVKVKVISSTVYTSVYEHCRGFGIVYENVEGSFVHLEGNNFKGIRIRNCPGLQGKISLPKWDVHFTGDAMHIGCQFHAIETWRNMPDEAIANITTASLEWWKQWKEIIFAIVDSQKDEYLKIAPHMPTLLKKDQELLEHYSA